MKNQPKKFRSEELRGQRWTLVVHGAKPSEQCPILQALIQEFAKDEYPVAAVSFETGANGIHPHWQIYFETAYRCTMKAKLTSLLKTGRVNYAFHLEVAKGTLADNINYVYAINKDYELGWVLYSKGVQAPLDYIPTQYNRLVQMHKHLYPWQAQLKQKLLAHPDDRTILWVYDLKGCSGKSAFTKYMHYFYGAIVTGGKSSDMKYAIARWREITGHFPATIIADVARENAKQHISYSGMQQIKNGMFFSGKYQSGMTSTRVNPHLLVFANQPPRVEQMTIDRWQIYLIDSESKYLIRQDLNLFLNPHE